MANILIAGCGYIGGALAERLAKAGHSAWGLKRTPVSLPESAHPIYADVLLPDSLNAIPREIEYAVYCVSANGRSEQAYRDAYVSGLRNVIDALRARCPNLQRLIYTSSTGVYGHNRGEWVDEDSTTRPSNYTGALVLEGERLLHESGLPGICVRFSGIYGPGRDRLAQLVRTGYRLTAQDAAYSNRIHRDDCAGVLEHLLFLDHPAEVYIGSDSEPAPRAEILRWLAERMGVELREEESSDDARNISMNKRLSNRRLLESGCQFIYPTYREGFASLI